MQVERPVGRDCCSSTRVWWERLSLEWRSQIPETLCKWRSQDVVIGSCGNSEQEELRKNNASIFSLGDPVDQGSLTQNAKRGKDRF